jgi:predicted AAA+ superfamily ATPase
LFDEYMRYGGYPELVLMETAWDKIEYLEWLVNTYIKKDISESWIRHTEKYLQLLQLLAGQTGKLVNMTELANIVWLNVSTIQEYLYTMQKSFHIWLLRPFSHNIRKEIVRMPKVYFHDAGLRNYCLNDYNSILLRQDKWECLEQAVRQQCNREYSALDIHYRRNKNWQEIDFIIKNEQAREIKRDTRLFKIHKYQQFVKDYPDIPLLCRDYEDILKSNVEKR